MKYVLCIVISLYLLQSSRAYYNDSFDEELFIKPLPSGHVYGYFQFTTLWHIPKDPDLREFIILINPLAFFLTLNNSLYLIIAVHHSHLFPRGLAVLIARHDVDELHISLTAGLWNYQKWGYPVNDAGPGAEIWAWFNENVKK